MEKPSRQQKETMNALFTEGYKNAAGSLAMLTAKQVNVTKVETAFTEPEALALRIQSGKGTQLLVTDLIGEVRGSSYLILTPYEAEQLVHYMLSSLKGFDRQANYRDILLKELDNVLAAAVITQLSNRLGLSIYGDVPSLIRLEGSSYSLGQGIPKGDDKPLLYSSACFTFDNDRKVQPSFIWILDRNFCSALHQKTPHHETSRTA